MLQPAFDDATRHECFARDLQGADAELAAVFEQTPNSDREIAERAMAMLVARLSSTAVPSRSIVTSPALIRLRRSIG